MPSGTQTFFWVFCSCWPSSLCLALCGHHSVTASLSAVSQAGGGREGQAHWYPSWGEQRLCLRPSWQSSRSGSSVSLSRSGSQSPSVHRRAESPDRVYHDCLVTHELSPGVWLISSLHEMGSLGQAQWQGRGRGGIG